MIRLFLLLAGFFSVFATAETFSIDTAKAYRYNEFSKRFDDASIYMWLEEDKSALTITIPEAMYSFKYVLKEDGLKGLRATLEKYFEWEEKAIKKKVTLNKEIGDFYADSAAYRIGKGAYSVSSTGSNIWTSFVSNDEKSHFLALIQSTVIADGLDARGDPLFFSREQAEKLMAIVSDNGLSAQIEKAKKEKAIADEFN